ncbi:hypothetical protein TNCT_422521 [Trichonephila clavata]|uniref:Uncharacterized protein n=1 Tax=Trichonephila clavata TaxID=2740835 RepID=A0A8X6IID6_TRICU|nr:hypothetical protein TNCT_422521 [Trichonephila clavata]
MMRVGQATAESTACQDMPEMKETRLKNGSNKRCPERKCSSLGGQSSYETVLDEKGSMYTPSLKGDRDNMSKPTLAK